MTFAAVSVRHYQPTKPGCEQRSHAVFRPSSFLVDRIGGGRDHVTRNLTRQSQQTIGLIRPPRGMLCLGLLRVALQFGLTLVR
jgi:hypothetical protein